MIKTLIVSIVMALLSLGSGVYKYAADGSAPGPMEWGIGGASSITAIITAIMAFLDFLKKFQPSSMRGSESSLHSPSSLAPVEPALSIGVLSREEWRKKYEERHKKAPIDDPDTKRSIIDLISVFVNGFGTSSLTQLMAIFNAVKTIGFPIYVNATVSWGKDKTYPLVYGKNPDAVLASETLRSATLPIDGPTDATTPSN